MRVNPIKTRVFKENENLVDFILEHIPALKDESVLVVTSKIVALSEGRTASLGDKKKKAELIKKESEWAIETKWTWLTVKDGVVMASAGIDESNADGKFILLPKNSFASAENLRKVLKEKYGVEKLGILLTDSRTIPLRLGVTAVAVGYAGFNGLRNYIGKPDIFGRKLTVTTTNVADGLATAAVLTMGEGEEQQPLAIIEGAKVEWSEKVDPKELEIPIEDDMYRPLFENLPEK